jgi:hypothetical protein
MVSDTLRFSSMPELIYVFARPRIDQRTCAQADAFLSLGDPTSASGLMPNISVTLGNRSGLMSSASAKTIYQIAVRNGYQGTWNDWVYGSGSLIMLAPATDLGLDIQNGDILSGEAGSVNFTIQAQFSNANYVSAFGKTAATPLTNLALELVVIPVYKGIATITPDNCVFNLGQLSEAEVSHLLHSADVISSEQVKPTIQGAGLFGRLKSVFGQVARGVQAVAPIAAQVAEHPIVQKLAQQAMGAQGGIISGASLHMRRRR